MLLKDRLRQLFVSYEPDVQRVLAEVLDLEQRYISYERPKIKEQIDEIITRVAEKKSAKSNKTRSVE